MSLVLQVIMIVSSIIFTLFIIHMISKGTVELKYSLIWLLAGFTLIIISLFPDVLYMFSNTLHILTPVNAAFVVIIFFLLLIVFTLTVAFSKVKNQVTTITQELALLKEKLEERNNIDKN